MQIRVKQPEFGDASKVCVILDKPLSLFDLYFSIYKLDLIVTIVENAKSYRNNNIIPLQRNTAMFPYLLLSQRSN